MAGGGRTGAGLALQVLKLSQLSIPPMQRHTNSCASLLQMGWVLLQLLSSMHAPLGMPASAQGIDSSQSTWHALQAELVQQSTVS